MAEADYRLMTEIMGGRIADALENLMPLQAAPYVATIPTGQWSGSGSDYYITVAAANVTANSILIPQYDKASASLLRGAVWCVPGTGSFTIHTSAIPAGTVSIMVMFAGTMGEAQYQVLADVYSKSQTDALIAQSAASAPTSVVTTLNWIAFGRIALISGEFVGNGTSSRSTGLTGWIGAVNVRNKSTGEMSIYFHTNASGEILGWDGSTSRTFASGITYQVSGVLYLA